MKKYIRYCPFNVPSPATHGSQHNFMPHLTGVTRWEKLSLDLVGSWLAQDRSVRKRCGLKKDKVKAVREGYIMRLDNYIYIIVDQCTKVALVNNWYKIQN